MRNLCVSNASISGSQIGDAEGISGDFVTGHVYVATKRALIFLDNKLEKVGECVWEIERAGASLVDLHFMADSVEVVAVFDNGLVFVISAENHAFEDPVFLDGEDIVTMAAWSPDGEVLVVGRGENIYFYNRLLLCLATASLYGEHEGKEQLVTIGWGKSETQFQGSIGKVARENREIRRKAYDDDDGSTKASWRADAAFVAVSFIDIPSGERRILIFNPDGELLSQLKNEQPFEEDVAVKPIGNYIATSKRDSNGLRCLQFFERNGEPRHEAKLFVSSRKRGPMKWNADGSILCLQTSLEHVNYLEFYTVSNYAWRLKLCLPFKYEIISWIWINEQELLIATRRFVVRLNVVAKYTVEKGVAFVVSGSDMCITNFQHAPIPPPMCEYTHHLRNPIYALIANDARQFALLDDFKLFEISESANELKFPIQEAFAEFFIVTASACSNLNVLCFCVVTSNEVEVVFTNEGEQGERVKLPAPAVALAIRPSDNAAIAVTSDGDVLELPNLHKLFHIGACAYTQIEFLEDTIIVLSSSKQLIANGKCIAEHVSSFLVRGNYVLYITVKSQMFILSAKDQFAVIENRAVELGSQLLAAPPEPATTVTLQMPRGNIETIHPRTFILEQIKRLIDSRAYTKALRQMKKHRVDMNLLVDHNPANFFADIPHILQDLHETELWNLFLTSLTDEKCDDKIDHVCRSFVTGILALPIDSQRSVITVLLTAYLKQKPQRIEEALKAVRDEGSRAEPLKKDKLIRDLLHYIGFFVDSKDLMSAAMATYDFGLVVQVAEAANQDPKEFLPVLNRLRKIEPAAYRYFHTDLVREDFKSALRHISSLEDKFEEAAELITQKQLYADALIIFRHSSNFKRVCELFAQHLESKAQWSDAALMFELAEQSSARLRCLEMARDPDAFYAEALKCSVSEAQIIISLKKMAIALTAAENWQHMLRALTLIKAPEHEICQALCLTNDFDGAIDRSLHNAEARKVVTLAIQSRGERIRDVSQTKFLELEKYAKRIQVVRQSKKQRLENIKEGLESGRDLEDIDAFSEASTFSQASRRTGASRTSTTATARKRKAIEKKKRNLKEGGEWEDAALLLATQEIYKTIETLRLGANKELRALVKIGELQLASEAQNALSKLEESAEKLRHVFWPHRLGPEHILGPLVHIFTIDHVLSLPSDAGMPSSFVLEPEQYPPDFTSVQWKIPLLP